MPMLKTIKITVTAVSMVNPCAVPRSKSAAPCTVKQHVHPATSCSYGWGILLQLRSDWVVNIAQSRKHHTRAEHAVLLCIRGLSFTGKPFCGARFRRFRRLLPPRVSFCSSGRRTIETVTSTPNGRCMMRNHDFVSDGFPAVIAASLVLLCSGWLAIAFS